MTEKNDLSQEEDGIDPKDTAPLDPSSDEDDDIIDLFDTVEMSDLNTEENVIERTGVAGANASDEEVLELTETVDLNADNLDEEILELNDIVDTADSEDETIIELTEQAGARDELEEDVIELSDTVDDEALISSETVSEPVDFADTIALEPDGTQELTSETQPLIEDEEIVELTETVDDLTSFQEDDGLELGDLADTVSLKPDITQEIEAGTEPIDEGDEPLDLTEAIEAQDRLSDEEASALDDFADTIALDSDITQELAVDADTLDGDDEPVELTDAIEEQDPVQSDEALALGDLADTVSLEPDIKQEIEADTEPIELTDAIEAQDRLSDEEASALDDFADTIALDSDITQELAVDADTLDGDDEAVELTEAIEEQDPVQSDEALELADLADTVSLDPDITQEIEADAEPTDGDDGPVELTDAVEELGLLQDEDELELSDLADTVALEPGITQDLAADKEARGEDEAIELAGPPPSPMPGTEALTAVSSTPAPVEYEEDKELLELIDDIQATLDEGQGPSEKGVDEPHAETEEAMDEESLDDEADDLKVIDDDELIQDEELPASESDFVDHLGIDLTSEIERKALEESEEALVEDVRPPGVEAPMDRGFVEASVKRAITEMLSEEYNPLTTAIEKAVKKALGKGDAL